MTKTIPSLLPRRRPCAKVVAAYRRSERRNGLEPLAAQELVRLLRLVAVHEAGHVVAGWEYGHDLESATIIATSAYMGAVEWISRPEDDAHAVLAGPVAQLIADPTASIANSRNRRQFVDYANDIMQVFEIGGATWSCRMPGASDATFFAPGRHRRTPHGYSAFQS